METITTTTTAVVLPSPLQLLFGGVLIGLGLKASSEAWDYSKAAVKNRNLLKAAASEKASEKTATATAKKPVAKKPATKKKA